MKISYFVNIRDNKKQLQLRRWYVDEITMLQDIGADVCVSTNISEIPFNADLYISWWAQSSIISVLIAKSRKKKAIVIPGGTEVSTTINEGGYFSKSVLRRLLVYLSLIKADMLIAVSEFNKMEILQIIGTKYEKKVKVIYHCVSPQYLIEKNNGKYENDKYLLMICAFSNSSFRRKCVFQVIDAINKVKREIKEVKLVIMGVCDKNDKLAYETINEYINEKKLGLNIELVINASEEVKIHYLKNAFYYLQPTFHEQFGVAIAEAMACGCPVISTNVAAVPEVVGDTGILISDNNVEQIAEAIKRVYFDDQLREKLSIKARNRVENNFSYDKKKMAFYKIIEHCVDDEK